MANANDKLLFGNIATAENHDGTFQSFEKPKRSKIEVSGQVIRESLNDSLDDNFRDFLINEAELHTYDDLTKVNPVTPNTVLKCLQVRYNAKMFYTHAGCTLVALNPFQPVPHLYSLDVMREYHNAPQPQEFKPHIFIVAEEAYRNLKRQVEPVNQSLVVSGESGAGKTWTSRCLMNYYATVATSQKGQSTVERIERRVLDSNPIMEAFGNACTLRNSNSSRFGKYIQLQMDSFHMLVGASVQTYLLEKTRVAFQAPKERNFHIFYQMMKGASETQRRDWMMSQDQDFTWLPDPEKTLEEEDCLQATVNAMYSLGILHEDQMQIFKILAGVLQLGNVWFAPASEEAQPCDLDEESRVFLGRTAALLLVAEDELQSSLMVRTLHAGKQSVLKPCSQSECSVRRDCLAKLIYAQLFNWLVKFINQSMCADVSMWSNFIGLLDVYGFECFLHNNLEQLCINYANEKLQQHFVAHYLKTQQEEYVSEGLRWSFIRYQDNQSCLDLIEGIPAGIFSLLNEECHLKRASDAQQFLVRLQMQLSHNHSIRWEKITTQPQFIVSHYAGNVLYDISGMMEKNKDPVPPELVCLLLKSKHSLLQSVFAEGSGESGRKTGTTVVSKFKSSVESLMSVLNSTTPHYTRCIKPNPDCRPQTFTTPEVISQLEACGIVETINISAAGFPIRIPFSCFLQRYALGQKVDGKISSGQSEQAVLRSAVQDLIDLLPDSDHRIRSMVHFGNSKIFLTHSMMQVLEEQRNRVLSLKAFCIQCCWRRYQKRQRALRTQAATYIQAGVRSWLVRTQMRKWHKAASLIQRRWRRCKVWLDALAKEELDDVEDLIEKVKVRDAVSCSSLQEALALHLCPLGPSPACVPGLSVSLSLSLQRSFCFMAALRLPIRSTMYSFHTNQFRQGVASIRAEPWGSVKLHLQKSALMYAHTRPLTHTHQQTGLNQILLDST